MRIKTERNTCTQTFHFPLSTRKLTCRPCGRRQSPHRYYLFILPILLLLIISHVCLFVLVFRNDARHSLGLVLLLPKRKACSQFQAPAPCIMHGVIKTQAKLDNAASLQQPATFDHSQARSWHPFYQPQRILLLRLPLVPRHICVLPMEVRIRWV